MRFLFNSAIPQTTFAMPWIFPLHYYKGEHSATSTSEIAAVQALIFWAILEDKSEENTGPVKMKQSKIFGCYNNSHRKLPVKKCVLLFPRDKTCWPINLISGDNLVMCGTDVVTIRWRQTLIHFWVFQVIEADQFFLFRETTLPWRHLIRKDLIPLPVIAISCNMLPVKQRW